VTAAPVSNNHEKTLSWIATFIFGLAPPMADTGCGGTMLLLWLNVVGR
jgi:hypothetical protein